MEFRKAAQSDIDVITRIAREAAREEDNAWDEEYPSRAQFEESLGCDGLYVAQEDGRVIASVGIHPAESIFLRLPCWSGSHQKPCDICRLCVRPDLTGRHIAENLLRYALSDAAKENGYDSVHFIAAQSNKRANRLYSRMGFRCVGETNWIGTDWFCYETELTEQHFSLAQSHGL